MSKKNYPVFGLGTAVVSVYVQSGEIMCGNRQ
jgi:hypothetical protein